MTEVKFREMRFDLDATVPFQWNTDNPVSGIVSNAISFMAVGFERYIVLVVKDAMKGVTDPAVREEADAFLKQEAQHSAAHAKHVKALVAQYPGLADALQGVLKSYEELYKAQPTKFHLAYIASIEATFTPLFSFIIDNRHRLMNGDCRIASLFLWHYVEELEHRSSANIIYDAVVNDRWYRVRTLGAAMAHCTELMRIISEGFATHVPPEDIGTDPMVVSGKMLQVEFLRRIPMLRQLVKSEPATLYEGISTKDVLKLFAGLLKSQFPSHEPGESTIPAWYDAWMKSYHAGEDMAHYFGTPARRARDLAAAE